MAVVWGTEPPAFSIGTTSPLAGRQGFTVLLDDAPDPDEVPDPAILGSPRVPGLPDRRRPELGRGLDIAREYGVADLDDDGEWVVGDLSRLDPA